MSTSRFFILGASLVISSPYCSALDRDPIQWPFSQDSIWNMPIGSEASFVDSSLPLGQIGPDIDYKAVATRNDPYRNAWQIYSDWWKAWLRVPDAWNVPSWDNYNRASAFIQPDGYVVEFQPSQRRWTGSLGAQGADIEGYIYDSSKLHILGKGTGGSHFGSGLSALGGTITRNEWNGSVRINHAIKLETDTAVLYKDSQPWRWPADRSDGDTSAYGLYNNWIPAQKMGALLAIPGNVSEASLNLKTTQGRALFYALQNYGGYIVDTVNWNLWENNTGYRMNVVLSPEAYADFNPWTNPWEKLDWFNDLKALIGNSKIVNNNGPTSVGGGGTPRVAMAPSMPAAEAPIGRYIALKAFNGLYVSCDMNDTNKYLKAKWASSAGSWEKFLVVDAGGGLIALKADNGLYVSCDLSDGARLKAAWAGSIGDWEKFDWYMQADGKVALRANNNGSRPVSADLGDGEKRMRADWAEWDGAYDWEKFEAPLQCLTGTYFDNPNFTGNKVVRKDKEVNFSWGTGNPIYGIARDSFSVRWTGFIMPKYSQTYTFYANTDDGVRLWVNGVKLIDKWTNQGLRQNTATIALSANTKYSIVMEYYDNTGGATAQLSWSSPSQPKEIIPDRQTFP